MSVELVGALAQVPAGLRRHLRLRAGRRIERDAAEHERRQAGRGIIIISTGLQ